MPPGVHALSNHLLDTPWPKVERSRTRLRRLLEREEVDPDALLDLLADREQPADESLPSTGVGLETERLLAPVCVLSPRYGTRSATVVLIGRDGEARFVERRLAPDGGEVSRSDHRFRIDQG